MLDLTSILLGFLLAFLVNYFSIPSIVLLSKKKKLYDTPNERSSTNKVVPTLGGIGIFTSFVFSLIVNPFSTQIANLPYLIGGVMLLFFIGLKDDLIALNAKDKMIAQLFSSLILTIMGGIRITDLHGFCGIHEIPIWASIVLSCFIMVVFINAFNLIDGIDGLASGLTMFICGVLGVWFFLTNHITYAIISFTIIGSLASFFYFNVFGRKNKLFMGDTGSMLIGLIVSVLIIQFNEFNITQTGAFAIKSAPAISFGLVIYPLFDTLRVFIIRTMLNRSPFHADKNHIHHRLLTMGYSHKRATFSIVMVNAIFIVPLFFFQDLGIATLMVYNILIAFMFSCIPARKIHQKDLIKRNDPYQQILYPKKQDAERLAMDALKFQHDSKHILIKALQRINLW